MSYSVKEISEKLDISPHTVRYYSDKGLIPTVQRDKHVVACLQHQSVYTLSNITHTLPVSSYLMLSEGLILWTEKLRTTKI